MRLRLLTVAALTAVLLPTLPPIEAALAEPIPQDPGAESVKDFLGAPREAKPITRGHFAPRHPFMAGNGRSNLHDDAYQSDAGEVAGPLGYEPEVVSTFFGAECGSLTIDRKGRLLTVCVGAAQVTLRMLDPDTLESLASYSLPPRKPSTTPFSSFGGGGYFYLDHQDRVVVPTSLGTIRVIDEKDGAFELVREYDATAAVGDSVIMSALPDWKGNLWFVSQAGVVGVVDTETGTVRSKDLGEGIGNSFAVDETGAVWIVSNDALYRFEARDGKPVVAWRRTYDNGDRTKPGQTQAGSGTTPTVIDRGGRKYVAITDNADPRMHVVVYRAGRERPAAPICKAPVFAPQKGATDNSLIAMGDSIYVENNYGYTGPVEQPPTGPARSTPTTEPGLSRVHVDYAGGSCRVAWTNADVRVPSVVSKGSAATGLIYTYEHPAADEVQYEGGEEPAAGPEDPWYLTALDARTGDRVWSVFTGVGLGYNNNYAPITLGPDGTAYIGVLGGLVAVRDTGTP